MWCNKGRQLVTDQLTQAALQKTCKSRQTGGAWCLTSGWGALTGLLRNQQLKTVDTLTYIRQLKDCFQHKPYYLHFEAMKFHKIQIFWFFQYGIGLRLIGDWKYGIGWKVLTFWTPSIEYFHPAHRCSHGCKRNDAKRLIWIIPNFTGGSIYILMEGDREPVLVKRVASQRMPHLIIYWAPCWYLLILNSKPSLG